MFMTVVATQPMLKQLDLVFELSLTAKAKKKKGKVYSRPRYRSYGEGPVT